MSARYWGAPQKATGCLRLAKALRETCKARGLTYTQVAGRTGQALSRCRVSQFANGHRSITVQALLHLQDALDAKFENVDLRGYSRGHGHVCRSVAGKPIRVTCRSTSNALTEVEW